MTNTEIKLTERVKALEKELKELKQGAKTQEVALPEIPVVGFRQYVRVQLRIRGFSRGQSADILNAIPDSKMIELLSANTCKFFPAFLDLELQLEETEREEEQHDDLMEIVDDGLMLDRVPG